MLRTTIKVISGGTKLIPIDLCTFGDRTILAEVWILVWEGSSVKMSDTILEEQRTCSLHTPAIDEPH